MAQLNSLDGVPAKIYRFHVVKTKKELFPSTFTSEEGPNLFSADATQFTFDSLAPITVLALQVDGHT